MTPIVPMFVWSSEPHRHCEEREPGDRVALNNRLLRTGGTDLWRAASDFVDLLAR